MGLLTAFILTGQFLALSVDNLLGVHKIYYAAFMLALVLSVVTWLRDPPAPVIGVLDIAWLCFGLFILLSALMLGQTEFMSFATGFFLQAVLPFLLGRSIWRQMNGQLFRGLQFSLLGYLLVLVYLGISDPSQFASDRFAPFFDRTSVGEAGGDPTQNFIGVGTSVFFLANFVRWKEESRVGKRLAGRLYLLILVLCVVILLTVASRASLISLVLSLAILERWIFSPKKLLAFAFVLLGGGSLAPFVISESRMELFGEFSVLYNIASIDVGCTNFSTESLLSRLIGISESIKLFWSSPIVGVGVGNYGWQYCGPKGDFIYPHNFFFQLLAELGILGTTFCIALALTTYRQARQSVGFMRTQDRQLATLILGAWLFTAFSAFFSGNYYFDIHFYLLSGMLVAMSRSRISKTSKLAHDRPTSILLPMQEHT